MGNHPTHLKQIGIKKNFFKNSMGGSRDATDLKFRRGGHFSTFQHTCVISEKSERNKGMSN